jgi:hypothetical protein
MSSASAAFLLFTFTLALAAALAKGSFARIAAAENLLPTTAQDRTPPAAELAEEPPVRLTVVLVLLFLDDIEVRIEQTSPVGSGTPGC